MELMITAQGHSEPNIPLDDTVSVCLCLVLAFFYFFRIHLFYIIQREELTNINSLRRLTPLWIEWDSNLRPPTW